MNELAFTSRGGGLRQISANPPPRHRSDSSVGRTVEPEVTVERVRPLLGDLGITRLADVTGLDHIGIPVAQAVRPNSRSLSVAQGKGTTFAAAMASAAMECIEFHHAEHIERPVLIASHRELSSRGRRIADVDLLARRANSRFNQDIRIPWISGRSTHTAQSVLVPYEMVDMDLARPRPYHGGCFYGGTNGLASGNCEEEAVAHALCELIERDANALWWHRPHDGPDSTRLDLDTINDHGLRQLIDRFYDAKVALFVWDMTSDLGIAAFSATAIDRTTGDFRRVPVTGGHGCHPNRTTALRRALTEVAQARLTAITATRDDISRASVENGTDVAAAEGLRDHLDSETPTRSLTDIAHLDNEYVEDDIALLLDRIANAGLPDPIIIDLTVAEVGIPVVKAIGPGLEPNPAERTLAGPRLKDRLASI